MVAFRFPLTRGSFLPAWLAAGLRRDGHRRNRVETKMHGVKLQSEGRMARELDRQIIELQVRAAALNGFTALGIPQTHPVG